MLEITEYDGVKIPSKLYELGDGSDPVGAGGIGG